MKLTAKRQVTFPASVIQALGLKPGDRIELVEGPGGYLLRAHKIDLSRLGTLKNKVRKGKGTFDIDRFREEPHATSLRD